MHRRERVACRDVNDFNSLQSTAHPCREDCGTWVHGDSRSEQYQSFSFSGADPVLGILKRFPLTSVTGDNCVDDASR